MSSISKDLKYNEKKCASEIPQSNFVEVIANHHNGKVEGRRQWDVQILLPASCKDWRYFQHCQVLEAIKNGKKPIRGNKAKIGSYIED